MWNQHQHSIITRNTCGIVSFNLTWKLSDKFFLHLPSGKTFWQVFSPGCVRRYSRQVSNVLVFLLVQLKHIYYNSYTRKIRGVCICLLKFSYYTFSGLREISHLKIDQILLRMLFFCSLTLIDMGFLLKSNLCGGENKIPKMVLKFLYLKVET